MRYLVYSLVVMFCCGCGEDTPCEKLMDIWQEICAIPDGVEYPCFPCSCALCGRHWDIPLRMGIPDIINAYCTDKFSCGENPPPFVETCLENAPEDPFQRPLPEGWIENECDPRYSYSIWLCDDGHNYNPALPELIDKGVESYDCVDQ